MRYARRMDDSAIDIRSTGTGLALALSNLAPYPFVIDGMACGGMEGFLQGLKVADPAEQRALCRLTGRAAYEAGQLHDWKPAQTLWWQGAPIARASDAYQNLLDRGYQALCDQSEPFRAALVASGSRPLLHTVGKTDIRDTVLTADEMVSRLTALRAGLRARR